VKNEIMDKLYGARMEPAMREYLKTLREQSFVVIKPGTWMPLEARVTPRFRK